MECWLALGVKKQKTDLLAITILRLILKNVIKPLFINFTQYVTQLLRIILNIDSSSRN